MGEKIPSADDILASVAARTVRKSKVDRWMEENPDKGGVFIEAVDQSVLRGLPLSHVISKCQEVLGGPPGSITTVRVALRRYVKEEDPN